MSSANGAAPALLVAAAEASSKTISAVECNAAAAWPSTFFDVLDRLDRNAAQALALLIGGVV